MALNQVRRDSLEFDICGNRLFVTQNLEFDLVAFEFSLHHFGHFHPLAFQLNGSVTRNRMVIDCQKHVPGLHIFGTGSGRDHGWNEDAAIIVLQTEKVTLGRV